ncbi:MAG: hypothetical protein ACRCUY_11750 [Thermoguttaceae bacterium]
MRFDFGYNTSKIRLYAFVLKMQHFGAIKPPTYVGGSPNIAK